MKVLPYQRAVEANATVNPNTRRSGDINAYGTNGSGFASLAEAFGKVNQEYLKQKENEMVVATTEANNTYNEKISDLLYNEKEGLMHKELGNARNLTEEFQNAERKIRAETMGNVPQYEKAHMAFNAMSDKALNQHLQNVRNYQYEQTEKHKGVVYEKNINNVMDLAVKSQSPENILHALGTIRAVTGGMYLNQKGSDAVELLVREKATNLVENSVVQILSNGNVGDWERAEQVLSMTEKYVDPGKLANLRSIIHKNQKADEKITMIKELRAKFGTDVKAAMDYLRANNTATIKTGGGAINSKESFFAAVGEQESGGNYAAENGRTGAFGKYQIMPGNWPSWSKEAGLPEGADMTSPENQEIVAKYKLGQYFDRYGAEGAMVAWYAGEQNGKRWAEGAADAIGEGGHYSWDARQGKGDEPSVREYVQQSLGKMGGNAETTRTEAKYSEQEFKAFADGFLGDIQREEALKNFSDKQVIESTGNQFFQMYQSGNMNISQYEKIAATASGGDDKLFRSLMGIANTYCRTGGPAGRSKGTKGSKFDLGVKPQIKEMMERGLFKTKQEFIDFVNYSGCSPSELNSMNELYNKWEEGKGEYHFDWDSLKKSAQAVSKLDANSPEWEQNWRGAKAGTTDFINGYIKENGYEPSYNEVLKEINKAFIDVQLRPNTEPLYKQWFGADNSVAYSPADLRNAGIRRINPLGDGTVAVYYSNGGEDTVTLNQLDAYVKQTKGEADTASEGGGENGGLSEEQAKALANRYLEGDFDNPNYSNTD